MDAAVYHREMARDPMRALVGVREVRRRAGEHALARAVGSERDAEAIERRAREDRDAAATALDAARAAARELVASGRADAGAIARADAYAARLRRRLSDAEADLRRAGAVRAAAAAATGNERDALAGAVADHRVAERALERKTSEARRVRERRED
jgi:hypothetical protein